MPVRQRAESGSLRNSAAELKPNPNSIPDVKPPILTLTPFCIYILHTTFYQCHGCRPCQVRTCQFHLLARRRWWPDMRYVTKHTYATECEPGDHLHMPGDNSRVTRRTYATACKYIYRARAHSLTCSELSTGWSVWKRMDVHEADGRASSTRAVADLLWLMLVVEQTVASSQQSVECGSTVGRSGRVVATRQPVSGGAWCVPESSRTSGQSAGSGDLRDLWSTADTCLVLLRGVGSPRARIEQRLV